MKKQILLLMILLFSNIIVAQTNSNSRVSLNISYDNQTEFYPSDEIFIRFTIKNNSPDVYSFNLAENKVFNTDLNVVGLDNQMLTESNKYSTLKSYTNVVMYREVNILPSEEFSFVQSLSDYKELKEGVYVISAKFYPKLNIEADNKQEVLSSNKLALSIKPEYIKENRDPTKEELQRSMVESLKATQMPPDEVVEYMLKARMNNEKEKYFLFMDVESLYKKSSRNAYVYQRLSETERFETLEKYKNDLWENKLDEDISLGLIDYEIISTSYKQFEGEVVVKQYYKLSNHYTEAKRFTYYFQKKENIWKIVNYEVLNLGNENPNK